MILTSFGLNPSFGDRLLDHLSRTRHARVQDDVALGARDQEGAEALRADEVDRPDDLRRFRGLVPLQELSGPLEGKDPGLPAPPSWAAPRPGPPPATGNRAHRCEERDLRLHGRTSSVGPRPSIRLTSPERQSLLRPRGPLGDCPHRKWKSIHSVWSAGGREMVNIAKERPRRVCGTLGILGHLGLVRTISVTPFARHFAFPLARLWRREPV